MTRYEIPFGWMGRPARPLLSALPGLLIGSLAFALLATPAKAQNSITGGVLGPGSATSGAGGGGGEGTQQNGKPAPRRPSALPGTRTEKTEAAPADRLASDMAPNAALFDGINRGDMAYVKDAISRGAELNARNILGLTPLDLSVDLGRTDITFLLLSLRGAEGGEYNGPSGPGSGKSAKAVLQAAAKAEPKPAKAARAAREAPPAAPAKPKLFADDGGTPIPNAGFLGFGAQK